MDVLYFHTVCDDHLFKDEKLFFRFRKDDGTYEEPADSAIVAKGQRIYSKWVHIAARDDWYGCMWSLG